MEQTPKICTRLATPADHDQVHALIAAYQQEHGQPSTRRVTLPDADAGPFYLLVAEREGHLVGFLAAQRCLDLSRAAQFLLLTDIFVPEEQRRRGAARALMDEVKALARRLGCERLSLVVSDFNLAALTTAARAGFTKPDQLLLACSEE